MPKIIVRQKWANYCNLEYQDHLYVHSFYNKELFYFTLFNPNAVLQS